MPVHVYNTGHNILESFYVVFDFTCLQNALEGILLHGFVLTEALENIFLRKLGHKMPTSLLGKYLYNKHRHLSLLQNPLTCT